MLQVNSGKLYPGGVRRTNELRGVLYSNLFLMRMEDGPIVTRAGRLLQAEATNFPRPIVYEVTEQFEDDTKAQGVLVSHGVLPYLQDFSAIVSFALRVTCTPDPDLVSRVVSERRSLGVRTPPVKLVRRVFDRQVWFNPADVEQLKTFTADLIALKRKSFLAAMRAIRTYVTGLHRVADDLELAYTLLVASLESLAQDFDGHDAQWSDYDQTKRQQIDKSLAGVDDETACRVRKAILKGEHVALGRRFREFVLGHLPDSYFVTDGRAGVSGRLDLRDALKEAYGLRSQYVHRLHNLPHLLDADLNYSETIRSGQSTFLTLEGLAYVARQVILQFVARQPKCETETYDYRLERFGIISAELAPQYWICRPEGLVKGRYRKYLMALLDEVAAHLWTQAPVHDMRAVTGRIEAILPGLRGDDRKTCAAIYLLFNLFVSPKDRTEWFPETHKKCSKTLSDPSIEALCLRSVFDITPNWSLTVQRDVVDAYFEKRNQSSGLRIPELFEAMVIFRLAEAYRLAGEPEQAKSLLAFAAVNILHIGRVATTAASFNPQTPIDWNVLLPAQPQVADPSETDVSPLPGD